MMKQWEFNRHIPGLGGVTPGPLDYDV